LFQSNRFPSPTNPFPLLDLAKKPYQQIPIN
jgi:hypothetical protein